MNIKQTVTFLSGMTKQILDRPNIQMWSSLELGYVCNSVCAIESNMIELFSGNIPETDVDQ